MADWVAKRFWKETSVHACDGGFCVRLDGRDVKTPAKSPLVVPTQTLADKIAAEWDAQIEKIDPATMPYTRSANAAIDKVSVQFDEVSELIAAYGATDNLCYRATTPVELIARQAETWDPILAWAAETFDTPLNVGAGVMHIAQPEDSVARLRDLTRALDPFALTAFHDLVSMTGSLVLGLAVLHNYADVDTLWHASRVDEQWQEDQWGEDDEATEVANLKRESFLHAANFYLESKS